MRFKRQTRMVAFLYDSLDLHDWETSIMRTEGENIPPKLETQALAPARRRRRRRRRVELKSRCVEISWTPLVDGGAMRIRCFVTEQQTARVTSKKGVMIVNGF